MQYIILNNKQTFKYKQINMFVNIDEISVASKETSKEYSVLCCTPCEQKNEKIINNPTDKKWKN